MSERTTNPDTAELLERQRLIRAAKEDIESVLWDVVDALLKAHPDQLGTLKDALTGAYVHVRDLKHHHGRKDSNGVRPGNDDTLPEDLETA